jgi:NAD(P)-dependent dehydrogenase (short-subunit alcohol dehydrogenase family)
MLKGKTAVVTGGGKGIGRAITLCLAEAGVNVIVVQRTPLDEELNALSNVFWTYADLEDPESIKCIVRFIKETFGSVQILVNNAGVMSEERVEDLELKDWQKILAVNTTFPLFLIKNLLPMMSEKGGSIINIGSVEGISANPHHTAYCTSKAALHGMTRSLAVDLGPKGIRCNAIAPGWIETALNDGLVKDLSSGRKYQDELVRLHPVGRTGLPEDVAHAVKFLAGDESAFLTGQIVILDGGRTSMLPLPA